MSVEVHEDDTLGLTAVDTVAEVVPPASLPAPGSGLGVPGSPVQDHHVICTQTDVSTMDSFLFFHSRKFPLIY